ncbi:Coiled-coil domain-containing protein 61 [Hondaea fermentalgiana]|uniref:Coiled-coil domain-containing protein 61 n=1 Tax=Hondaea fermentalgiana TaxID=2315210 RepID=A0A2R5GTD7_9STRA|nr:Coiled-coil domain-containing protein 61 [Hondaea fermentalgiana]|eukprot:GBG33845.1 Coiled-coil domain-containing protein 61 [Hondaea fermentalgiana]
MDHSVATSFHGVDYVLSWADRDGKLVMDLEDMHTADQRWYSELDTKYVEGITRKTGNFKRFTVFCKMLLAAMTDPSDSLYADILTLQDLEMLKARQLRGGGASPSHQSQSLQHPAGRPGTGGPGKRYLIVTFVTQFDRVHYPLPLAPCTAPTPEMLLRTIRRLHASPRGGPQDEDMRVESVMAAAGADTDERIAELQEENERLRELLRKNKALKRKSKAVTAMSEEVQHQLEEEREQWLAEREVLEEEIEGLRGELDAVMAEERQTSRSLDQQTLAVNKENRVLREKVASLEQALEKERESHKRVQDRRKRELENALQELNRLRTSNRQLRSRVKDNQSGVSTSGTRGRATPRSVKSASPANGAKAHPPIAGQRPTSARSQTSGASSGSRPRSAGAQKSGFMTHANGADATAGSGAQGLGNGTVNESALTNTHTVDTSVEMDDIDKRLAQLQTFLKQEKAKASFAATDEED